MVTFCRRSHIFQLRGRIRNSDSECPSGLALLRAFSPKKSLPPSNPIRVASLREFAMEPQMSPSEVTTLVSQVARQAPESESEGVCTCTRMYMSVPVTA